MKKILIACAGGLLALSAFAAVPAKAEVVYPWCKDDASAERAQGCGFVTFAQCRATLGTEAGICSPNPRHTDSRGGMGAYAYAPGVSPVGSTLLGAGVGAVVGGPVGAAIGAGVGASAGAIR